MTRYTPTPISEKPKKDDNYFVKFKGVPELSEVMYENNKWQSNWTEIAEFWLKPVTGVLMTEEQLKEMIDAARTYNDGWVETPDEIIKRFYSS